MIGEELYDAASKEDATKFRQLVQQDPSLVERVLFPCSRNVLHVATLRGHLAIVEEVLVISPELALEPDSKNSSPLHIAAAKGNVEIAKILLGVAPEMCWCRDSQGLNPVHIAAMKGDDGMLAVLLEHDRLPAMERVHRGQTVLHLCVKHRQLKALQFLVQRIGELVYAKDDDGETLLHWAVKSRHDEIVEMLVRSGKIEMDSMNSMGRTAAQIYVDDSKFIQQLRWNSVKVLMRIVTPSPLLGIPSEELAKRREQTMVAMTLIAAMAFQAAINPPGGVWQEDTSSHNAGEAVIAYTHPKIYKHLVNANAATFVSSIITISLLTVPLRIRGCATLLLSTYTVWLTLASIAISYGASVLVISPNTQSRSPTQIINVVVAITVITFLLISLWNILSSGLLHLAHKLINIPRRFDKNET